MTTNKNLLLCHSYLEMALLYALKADKAIYADDLLVECNEAIMASNSLIEAIESAKSGVVDDIMAFEQGTNHKVVFVDFRSVK